MAEECGCGAPEKGGEDGREGVGVSRYLGACDLGEGAPNIVPRRRLPLEFSASPRGAPNAECSVDFDVRFVV